MTFIAFTMVFYEREGKVHLLQHVHLVRADTRDAAAAHIEAWLDEGWPEPAYFDHGFEMHPLPDVTIEGENAALDFALSESPITIRS